MNKYKMKNGKVLTDADFERMSEEAERGIYPGTPGEWIIKPKGRPKLAEEDLVVVTCKVSKSQRDAIDNAAKKRGESRSDWMRETFTAALLQQNPA